MLSKKGFSMLRFCFWIAAIIGGCIIMSPAHAQVRSIVIGEGVRGAMYLPAYIAEEPGIRRHSI